MISYRLWKHPVGSEGWLEELAGLAPIFGLRGRWVLHWHALFACVFAIYPRYPMRFS